MADDEDDDLGDSGRDPARYQARITKLSMQKNQLRKELDEAASRYAELEAKFAASEKSVAKITALESELAQYRDKEANWTTERDIMSAGVTDPEGLAFVTQAWRSLADDVRPKGGVKEWLESGETLPKGVRIYLPEQANQSGNGTSGSDKTVVNHRSRDLKAKPISQMSPEEYKQHRESIFADLGMAVPKYG